MGSLRILIVDDHETVRRGLRALLSTRPDWVVCGEAADGLEAVEKAKSLRPDVVVMDISMPRMDGVEATKIIRQEVPESKVIIVSQNDPTEVKRQAAEIDAGGYVDKADLARDLLPTVENLVADRSGKKTKKVRGATVARRGVSQRKLVERTDNLLAAIVDSSDDAIISKTLDGIITSWNKSAEQMFGYTGEEAVGRHITLIIPEDRRDEEAKIVEQLSRGERVDHFETLRVRKDGTLLDLSLTISPVKDATGRVIGASKVARDITQRKQVEQALAERARLLDLSNDAIFVRDEADRVTYWNRSASDLYGYTREEAVGRVSHELLRTEFPEALDSIIEQLHHDNRWTGELIHTHKNGSQIVVASRWALDRDDGGNRKRILETNNDITQQRRNEKALRESEERLRTLSDGLEVQVRARTQELEERNAEILQQSDQLRELSNRLLKTQDDERRRIARELHDSAGQLITVLGMNIAGIAKHGEQNPSLAEIVEDTQNLVQQLSREIRTTSYLLHPPLLDENGLSQAIHWYMQGLTERTDLEIELNIPENFGRLPADLELTIFRIVQEGLTNIHRHSGSKTATIRLSRNANSVLLKIEDHGKGISPEKLVAIRAQRTGVGITGMRERVRHLKGAMDIQSNGTGATISVTFPIPVIPTSIATSGSDRILQSLEATG
jgi:PAS domain S-box-containing protein